ncbi:MAG: alpha/beta hydrolase [Oscillospiraceae bacterium]|nr:alpha/beta hydrolase [Oscillospiraceae bacterium]
MKAVKIILLVIVILAVLIGGGCTALLAVTDYQNKNYWKYAAPAGEIEKKYTAMGELDVSYSEFDAKTDAYQKYEIWYPSEMINSDTKYPLVVMANGTGVRASEYQEVFKHLASWGFIAVGNEDDSSLTGASSAETLDFMLAQNENTSSVFYGKIDIENIGIAGHSQGGLGAVNAVTNQNNGNLYKAIWTASATSPYWGQDDVFGAAWRVDMSKINIPCFMVAGTGPADAGTATDITQKEGQGICPLWGLTESYNAIPDGTPKVMARLIGKDHGDMLRYADGYMTAWFMYYLKGDDYAGGAFFGDNAEISTNANWQDVQMSN